jgi:hypothetical protein
MDTLNLNPWLFYTLLFYAWLVVHGLANKLFYWNGYVRYWHYHIALILPMQLTGYVITPLLFPIKDIVRTIRFYPLYIYLNNTEKDKLSNDFGHESWRNAKGFETANFFQKWWIFIQWNARNPHFVFKNMFRPHPAKEWTDIKEKVYEPTNYTEPKPNGKPRRTNLTWNNRKYHGRTHITGRVGRTRYYRFSYTEERKGRLKNAQRGYDEKRLIFKLRSWKD